MREYKKFYVKEDRGSEKMQEKDILWFVFVCISDFLRLIKKFYVHFKLLLKCANNFVFINFHKTSAITCEIFKSHKIIIFIGSYSSLFNTTIFINLAPLIQLHHRSLGCILYETCTLNKLSTLLNHSFNTPPRDQTQLVPRGGMDQRAIEEASQSVLPDLKELFIKWVFWGVGGIW